MIRVNRMDRQEMHLNPDQILSIEATPDVVITMFNGHRFIVRDSIDAIIGRIAAWRARVIRRAGSCGGRKYLRRERHAMFHSTTLNREVLCPEEIPLHERSTFHTRDC